MKRKVKVLHVVLSMETGGLENGIVNLVNHSNKNEFIVDILCLRSKGELADRIDNPNSNVIFDGNSNPSLLTSIKKIVAACNTGQYDIVHSHGFTTMLASYIAKILSTFPILINGEHGTLYFDSLKKRLIQKYLFSRMDLNLTVSAELKRKISHIFNLSKDNFKPIINGVDTNRFKHNSGANNLIRNNLNIDNNQIIIGSVGRLVPGKDYKSLIMAFSSVSSILNNVHLVIAGDGPEYSNLNELIKSLDLDSRVHLLGRRDDIPDLLSAFDIFVLSSKSEGLSNTLLEAMSSSIPVIACNVGGNPEIVLPNISGFLYESGDESHLSKLLASLCKNRSEIEILSNSARNHIINNHSLISMVNNYEETYYSLLNASNLSNRTIEA